MSMRTKLLFGMFLAISLLPFEARAHWCDDLWASSYNIVVRPATDTVTLSGGSATMNIAVQNNMGYALPNFVLTAKIGTTAITATRKTGTLSGSTLYPGQKAQYTLAVTGTGTSVKIEDISFFVSFGNSGESKCYPTKGADAVMVKKNDGTLVPSANPPAGLSTAANPGCTGDMTQARQLQYAAQTDFINASAGLDTLMNYYCAGRGTWNSQSDAVISTGCTGTATVCTKATGTGAGTKWQYPHLWASLELVARKSALGATRITTLRQRLQCGAQDANTGFAGFAMMMLGYLGDDGAGNTFLVGQAGGTGDLATIAKAALLLATSNKTTYEAAVKAGLTGSTFVKAACAAAIGIVDLDDATVTSDLVPLAQWKEPDGGDNGQSIYAAYLLSLVAWDRRCWAANAGDVGSVSFYEGGTPARCTGAGGSTGGSTGSTGGATAAGGSTGSTGGTTAMGGKSGTASGGSTGTPSAGTTAMGGKTGIASGGTTGTPVGGTTGTPVGGTTGTPVGGTTGKPVGGTTGTPVGGTTGMPVGGTTGTPVGGTGTPVAGNTETGGKTVPATGGTPSGGIPENSAGAAGGVPVETGGNTGPGVGGQTGSPSSGSASNSGSASGCGYAPSGRATIPLGFVLAGLGLALARRRRRR
jgi:MYXO-CTERM domain-containing protein